MTCVATRNVAHAADVVFFYQRRPQIDLIRITLSIHNNWMSAGGRPIAHIENLIARPKIILRRAMAA
jgi:hypothetical protein